MREGDNGDNLVILNLFQDLSCVRLYVDLWQNLDVTDDRLRNKFGMTGLGRFFQIKKEANNSIKLMPILIIRFHLLVLTIIPSPLYNSNHSRL